jgi:hypothetical protein
MKSTRKIDYNDGIVGIHLDEGCSFGPNIFYGYCYALNEDGTEIVRTEVEHTSDARISIGGNGSFSMLKRGPAGEEVLFGFPKGRLAAFIKGMF